MKVLNICRDDWANFMCDITGAMIEAGIDATGMKLNAHVHRYSYEANIAALAEMRSAAAEADIVQVFHSDVSTYNAVKGVAKKIIVWHTGTAYRGGHENLNKIFSDCFAIVALPELYALVTGRCEYVVGAINTREYIPHFIANGFPRLAHYPSNGEVKGSAFICKTIESLKERYLFTFDFSDEKVEHEKNKERVQKCDIYLELFSPTNNGKPYGSFGISALEAAAFGKVVITQNIVHHIYQATYGTCPLVLAKDEKDFEEKIKQILTMPRDRLRQIQYDARNWMEKKHSYLATGKRIKNIIQNEINGSHD